MTLLLTLVAAASVTALCIGPMIWLAPRLGLVDPPGPRKIHHLPIPRIGGVTIIAGVVAALFATVELNSQLRGVLLGGALLFLVGLWDDFRPLHFTVKFAGQAVACLVALASSGVAIDSITLVERIALPPVLAFAVTFFFLMGVINALNFTDGLDGLAAGAALLSTCAVAAFGMIAGNMMVLSVAAALAGALLGFLPANTHPARLFMGDSGSLFLGFAAAMLAILCTQGDTALSAALPVLVMGWPIMDTISVVGSRLRRGVSPFSADQRHLHHRLLALGLPHGGVVMVVYGVQASLLLLAYVLRFTSDLWILLAFCATTLLTLTGIALAERWRLPQSGAIERPQPDPAARVATAGENSGASTQVWLLLLPLLLLIYAGSVLAGSKTVPLQIGWLAALLSVSLLALLRSRSRIVSLTARALQSVVVVLLVFMEHDGGGLFPLTSSPALILFGVLLLAVAATLSRNRRGAFRVTSLDLLMPLAGLLLWAMAGWEPQMLAIAAPIAKALLLLYAMELIAITQPGQTGLVLASIGCTGLLAMRYWFS